MNIELISTKQKSAHNNRIMVRYNGKLYGATVHTDDANGIHVDGVSSAAGCGFKHFSETQAPKLYAAIYSLFN